VGFVAKNPAVLSKILQFGLMSACGQFFIFFLVKSFSALTLVTVTTTRKFFTVLASVFWFKHKLTLGQWLSVAFVFTGLAWEEASNFVAKQRAKALKAGAAHSTPAPAAPPAEEKPAAVEEVAPATAPKDDDAATSSSPALAAGAEAVPTTSTPVEAEEEDATPADPDAHITPA